MKPHLPITLAAIDTGRTAPFTRRALDICSSSADFDKVIFLTNRPRDKRDVAIDPINSLEEYSNFVARKLHNYISTSHVLLVQWDGYMLNPEAWQDYWLTYDFIGAPKAARQGAAMNGGFSLRSLRLLRLGATHAPLEGAHPEDQWFTAKHRGFFESFGCRFAESPIATAFAHEARVWSGDEWRGTSVPWQGEFGFHSWLTPMPDRDHPFIFHHSGDAGDVIYSLPVVKALGGGPIFFSGDNKFAFPGNSRWGSEGAPRAWVENLAPLLEAQPYVWKALYTKARPHSVDCDLNAFRQFYRSGGIDRWSSLFTLHQKAFGIECPEDEPWLEVPERVKTRPIVINRTARFQNPLFPWGRLLVKHAKEMVFIGSMEELSALVQQFPFESHGIEYLPTGSLLEVAKCIAGAKVFIGNQSCPLAIAHGLGQKVIVECWIQNSNCELKRPNAIYVKGSETHIPEHWLT